MHIDEYIIHHLKQDLINITVLWILNIFKKQNPNVSAHFEIKLGKIGRIELELFKFQKWTHKNNTLYKEVFL